MSSYFIHGFHAVIARLRHHPDSVLELFLDPARQDARMRDLMGYAAINGRRVVPADAARLAGMAGVNARHQGVVARVTESRKSVSLSDVLDTLDENAVFLVLDGVQDPHNLGACLRVADAAGARAVIAPKDRAVGLTQTAIKAASGAAETVPYIVVTNLARALRELKEYGVWIIGADGGAPDDLYAAQWPKAAAWVLGAEGDGLRRLTLQTCDQTIRIPMYGSVPSLNVSVAAGICLFESRRRSIAG